MPEKSRTQRGYSPYLSAAFQQDELQGFLCWTVELASGARSAVQLRYRIQLPDDWKLD